MQDRRLTLTRALRERRSRDCYVRPTEVPLLRVQGQWLAAAGFQVGDRVRVEVRPGRLIVTPEEVC